FLIYECTEWIGSLFSKLFEVQSILFVYSSGRHEKRSDIANVNPSHVFNAAGMTSRPNVDWCESHKVETIRMNVVGTLTLVDVCCEKGLILINYATGFKEEDTPNFIGSFYSKTKAVVEDLLLNYENVCTLRVRKFLTQ
ncbi:hypothetical protein S83_050923, partial [Arachis hypogaea]